jgi:predicted nucleic acid-binding Zn ribbon protein
MSETIHHHFTCDVCGNKVPAPDAWHEGEFSFCSKSCYEKWLKEKVNAAEFGV